MNGTDKIIEQIAREAKLAADAVMADAERDASAVRAEYSGLADKLYQKKIEEGKRAIADQSDSTVRIASMEARKLLLSAKQEMVAAAFGQAAQQIAELPEDERIAFLAKLAADASEEGGEEVLLCARDAALAPKVCEQANALLAKAGKKGALTPAKDNADISGGVVLRRGRIEINCAVELLIDRLRSELSAKVADVLFG